MERALSHFEKPGYPPGLSLDRQQVFLCSVHFTTVKKEYINKSPRRALFNSCPNKGTEEWFRAYTLRRHRPGFTSEFPVHLNMNLDTVESSKMFLKPKHIFFFFFPVTKSYCAPGSPKEFFGPPSGCSNSPGGGFPSLPCSWWPNWPVNMWEVHFPCSARVSQRTQSKEAAPLVQKWRAKSLHLSFNLSSLFSKKVLHKKR